MPTSGLVTGFDWVLCLAVLALGFLIASFTVRNSDFWQHLAVGRLLAAGDYSFGKDPFSHTGTDRKWVNHAWLYDWGLFQLFRTGGGQAVVIAKGILVALAAGMLLLARRPGQVVFPGIVCVTLALLAAAPRLHLQPVICTLVCLALLLLMLIRCPKPAGSWRFPMLVAGLFALWSNLDQWFILGPAALLLYTIGQYVRPDEGVDPITLWKAVGLGVVACMVNPHHVGVWILPPEAADRALARIFADDIEIGPMFRSVLSKGGLDFAGERDNPLNLYSLVTLLALGLLGFALNYKRASVGLALVWLGAVALTLAHLRATPLLAFVAAPIAAVNLADWARRFADTPRTERMTRSLHAARTGGRALALMVVLLLIAVSYAGWLHAPGQQRRWAWAVQPDQSMQQMAETLRDWRASGQLPAEAKLLNFQPDFANYVAWFAPDIKTYFDYRFKFHRDEAADYAALRKALSPAALIDQQPGAFDLPAFLRANGIVYGVTVHLSRGWNEAVLMHLLNEDRDPARGADWSIWSIHGRAVALGWNRQQVVPRSQMSRLEFDPEQAAFAAPGPLPVPDVHPPIAAQSIWDRYVFPPPKASPYGEESFILMRLRDSIVRKSIIRQKMAMAMLHVAVVDRLQTPALSNWTVLPVLNHPVSNFFPTIVPMEANTLALLAVRAARRAIHESPDHPDGYYYLALAYPEFAAYVFAQDMQELVTSATLARCRVRIPDDPTVKKQTIEVQDLCDRLRGVHQQALPPRLDLWLDATRLSLDYMRADLDEREATLKELDDEQRKEREQELELRTRRIAQRERDVTAAEAGIKTNSDQFVNVAASRTSPLERAALARQFGLIREAIGELYKTHETLQKQLENESDRKRFTTAEIAQQLAVHAELIELMLYDGRVEEAAQILDSMDDPELTGAMESEAIRTEYLRVRSLAMRALDPRNPPRSRFDMDPSAHYRSLRQAVMLVVGDLKGAAESQAKDLQSVRKDLETFRAQHFPKGAPKLTELPKSMERDLDIYTRPWLAPLAYARGMYFQNVQQFFVMSQAHVDLNVRLGLVLVEYGDVKNAVHHFRQALDSPDWAGAQLPAQRIAEQYLQAINKANRPQGDGR